MNNLRLCARISEANLFSSLGAKIDDFNVSRISSWEDWLGPEEPLVQELASHLQFLQEGVLLSIGEPEWNQALQLALEMATKLVPYIPGEDAWYGPNTAAWIAAWVFVLEEAYISCDVPLPAEVNAQLYWYRRGHWPCALVIESQFQSIEDYVVY